MRYGISQFVFLYSVYIIQVGREPFFLLNSDSAGIGRSVMSSKQVLEGIGLHESREFNLNSDVQFIDKVRVRPLTLGIFSSPPVKFLNFLFQLYPLIVKRIYHSIYCVYPSSLHLSYIC